MSREGILPRSAVVLAFCLCGFWAVSPVLLPVLEGRVGVDSREPLRLTIMGLSVAAGGALLTKFGRTAGLCWLMMVGVCILAACLGLTMRTMLQWLA